MIKTSFLVLTLVGAVYACSVDQGARVQSQERSPQRSEGGSQGQCLHYEPEEVTIIGQLTIREEYGPPNFGETPDEDERVRVPVLVLRTPVDVCGDPASELNRESFKGVTQIQVIMPESATPEDLAGRRVEATGVLFRAMTGHHYTDVVLRAAAVSPLDAL